MESPEEVHTPDIRTVEEVCEFLGSAALSS